MRSLLLLGDTHIGSNFAPWVERYRLKSGNIIEASEGQLKLLNFWHEMRIFADKHKVDTVIHGGDAIEGNNRKEFGALLTSPYIDTQEDVFYNLHLPIVKNRIFYIVKGSGYHASIDTNVIQHIEDKFKAVCRYVEDWGMVQNATIEGLVFNIMHGGGASPMNTATWLQRQIKDLKELYANGDIPKIDEIRRWHWHKYDSVKTRFANATLGPAWKTYAPDKIHSNNYFRMHGDIGFEWLAIEKGKIVDSHVQLFQPPLISDFLTNK